MKKVLSIIISVFMIAAMFAGCGSKGGTTFTAVGVQNTQNSSSINCNGALSNELSEAFKKTDNTLTVVEIDGDPYPVGKNITAEYDVGSSSDNKASRNKMYTQMAVKTVNSDATPKTAEIDMLKALTVLSRSVNSLAHGSEKATKRIVVCANLLSTTGKINFVDSTLYFDTENYIEYLGKELPDMNDISVTWIVTATEGEQESLNNSDISKLEDFYRTLIEKAGGNVKFIEENNGGEGEIDKSGWPDVSAVDVRKDSYKGSKNLDVTLDDTTLFKSDSTEWLNEEKATAKLESLVDVINDSECNIVIAGSTAATDSSEEQHVTFSKKRADTVMDKLISLGADASKLKAVGIGKSYSRYRVKDTGEFNTEENHKQNRVVFIVSEDTDKAQYFLEVAEKFPNINK
jgi:outer membrane protein OmpA-like peptidoglycan-associated protein